MLNGRDDNKYEGSDDSEYHFSDDEVNYEAEPESGKSSAPRDVQAGDFKSTGSAKKMLIGLGVFFGLVFVTYKMVAPVNVVPPTDIAPQAAAVQQQAMPQVAQQQHAAAPLQAVQQSAPPSAQQPAQQASTEQSSAIQQMQQMVVQQPQEVNPVQQPPASSPQSVPVDQQASAMAATQTYQSAPAPDNSGMPQVIPVQAAPSVAAVTGSSMPTPAADAAAAALASENSKLSRQLESEYAQRITEYQSQNKNLQEQVQTLNSRVANMENEMNQLIQTLTQQFQGGGTAPAAVSTPVGSQAAAPVEQAGPPPRVPYNVQAIIPGRAWLRANNGDTLTVAEGDDIKGIGRVTKIDPYDGIVEINVQGRSVSLSYGNGS
jgi:intracellular multiplication protein IcmG